MLMRFDPFTELDRMAEQLWRSATSPVAPMDAYRRGDHFYVDIDVPGVDPSSIDLTAERNVLTVTATRSRPFAEGDQVLVSERPQGQFRRQLFLGDQLDTADIGADYRNGVLHLTLKVAEQAKPRKVEISTAGDAPAIAGGLTGATETPASEPADTAA